MNTLDSARPDSAAARLAVMERRFPAASSLRAPGGVAGARFAPIGSHPAAPQDLERTAWLALCRRFAPVGERPLSVSFAPSYEDGAVVKHGDFEILSRPLGARSTRGEEDAGRIVYPSAYAHTDVVHVVGAARSEEFFHLENASAPTCFEFELTGLSGAFAIADEERGLRLATDDGHSIRIEAPWVMDATGRRSDTAVSWHIVSDTEAARKIVALRLDPTGLSYPLLIDPSWTTIGSMKTARSTCTATVLADGRVLVTGGDEIGSLYANTSCEIFDPETCQWSRTGSMKTGRVFHSATLLGDGRVLAVGGINSDYGATNPTLYHASCEIYDPATGIWTACASLPSPRAYHEAVALTSGVVLVAGGLGGDNQTGRKGCLLYDSKNNTWTATGAMVSGRFGFTATLLPSGGVLAAGGAFSAGLPIPETEIYNPVSGTWSAAKPLPFARMQHTAVLLATGEVLVIGGEGVDSQTGSPVYFASCELFSSSGEWLAVGSLATARFGHQSCLLPSGAALALGGYKNSISTANLLSSCEVFDPVARTWSAALPMSVTRGYFFARTLHSGLVLAGGGSSGNTVTSSCEVLDYRPDRWTATGSVPSGTGLASSTATLLPSGKVLVTGGFDPVNQVTGRYCNLYDPATGAWSSNGALQQGRCWHTATLLPSGAVLIAGGLSAMAESQTFEIFDPVAAVTTATGNMNLPRCGAQAVWLPVQQKVLMVGGAAAAELYDPTTKVWTLAASMSTRRNSMTATLLPDGRVLVAGGSVFVSGEGLNYLSACEIYDPVADTWSATGSLSTARAGFTATLLWTGQVLVVGGITSGGAVTPTCELYSPSTGGWTPAPSLAYPCYGHTASTLENGLVLIAGGGNTTSSSNPSTGIANCALFDPAANNWRTNVPVLLTARQCHTSTRLLSGGVLVATGQTYLPLDSCELFG